MSGKQFLSDKIGTIGSSGIRRVFDLAATMKDPIDLSMGQPDFKVPDAVKEAAVTAIRNDRNGYTVTHGLPELREGIARYLEARLGWKPGGVFCTCGVSGGLVLAMMACLNPGDEVVLADPYFVSYPHLIKLFGGRPVPVSLYDKFRPDADAFAAAITPKTKMILLNSPANPTGLVFTPDEIQAIAELAEKHDILLVSDEIYARLSYDGRPASPAEFAPERTLMLGGFGKSHALTGWRTGFAAGPADVIREMAKVQQYTYVCMPHPAQVACLTALETDTTAQADDYRRKRDLVVAELAGAFEFARPSGGFYVFPRVPAGYPSAAAFVEEAIRNNCLVIPGSVFSQRDTHFRLSYAVPDERLKRGCEILRRLVR